MKDMVDTRIRTLVGLTVADYLMRLGIAAERIHWGVGIDAATRRPSVCLMVKDSGGAGGPVRFAFSVLPLEDAAVSDDAALEPMLQALRLWNGSTQAERTSIVEMVEGLGVINRVELVAKLQEKGLYPCR